MTTFSSIAHQVSQEVWGFSPTRPVKPIHFANGFVRALTGSDGKAANLLREVSAGARSGKAKLTNQQVSELIADRCQCSDPNMLIDRVAELRSALDLVLHQDRAWFAGGPFASATLTHANHATNDPSDNGSGRFVAQLLAASSKHDVIETLCETVQDTSDDIYLLTLPLLPSDTLTAVPPASQQVNDILARSHVLRAGQVAFETLAKYTDTLEKTMFLQRVVRLGSFLLFVHLINSSADTVNSGCHVPILLCSGSAPPSVRDASRATFVRARQQIERAFEEGLTEELRRANQDKLSKDEYLALAEEWLPNRDEMQNGRLTNRARRQRRVLDRFRQDFRAFSLGSPNSLSDAFRRAAVRAMFFEMDLDAEDPEGFASFIGRHVGLVYPRLQGAGGKYYLPAPELLDMLLSSVLQPGQEVTSDDFWEVVWERFGVVGGLLGSVDFRRLSAWNVRQASPKDLERSGRELLQDLVRMGHAREYADDVTLIRSTVGS